MDKLIKVTDVTAVIEAIEKAEGNRVYMRRISHSDIVYALEAVERRLSLPKKYMNGIEVHVDVHAQRFPNCYKGTPDSTHFTAVYKSNGWRIMSIFRDKCTPNPNHVYSVTLTEEAKREIVSRRLAECTLF